MTLLKAKKYWTLVLLALLVPDIILFGKTRLGIRDAQEW